MDDARDDDIIECECGSRAFTVARDGFLECADCRVPIDDLMALEIDLRSVIDARGIQIIGDDTEQPTLN